LPGPGLLLAFAAWDCFALWAAVLCGIPIQGPLLGGGPNGPALLAGMPDGPKRAAELVPGRNVPDTFLSSDSAAQANPGKASGVGPGATSFTTTVGPALGAATFDTGGAGGPWAELEAGFEAGFETGFETTFGAAP
jgi:hypothetical protein